MSPGKTQASMPKTGSHNKSHEIFNVQKLKKDKIDTIMRIFILMSLLQNLSVITL